MKTRAYQEGDPLITQLKGRIDEKRVVINFKWPNTLEQICIYKKNVLQEDRLDWMRPYRRYTRDEYMNFGGFKDEVCEAGMMEYTLCPLMREGDETYIILYPHLENTIEIFTNKIQIKYTIKEKSKLFSNIKRVQMNVFCDTEIKKETICYVKKKGAVPVSEDDGIQFRFMKDFSPGNNILPEIEMDKDDYVRIYLAKDVKHKELYLVYKQ